MPANEVSEDLMEHHVALGYIDLLNKAHAHHQEGLEGIHRQLEAVKDRMSLINYVLKNLDALSKEVFEANGETEIRLNEYRRELKELALQFQRSVEENKYHVCQDMSPVSEELLAKCEGEEDLILNEADCLELLDKLHVWRDAEENTPKHLAEKHSELSSEYLAMSITATSVKINDQNEAIVRNQLRGA